MKQVKKTCREKGGKSPYATRAKREYKYGFQVSVSERRGPPPGKDRGRRESIRKA